MRPHSNPRLWIPEAPAIVPPERVVHVAMPAARMAGRFTLELVHARTGDVTRRLAFDNLITNVGMDHLGGLGATAPSTTMVGGTDPRLNYCAVGTGPADPQQAYPEPAFTDTVILGELLRTNAKGGFTDNGYQRAADNSYSYCTVVREFSEEQANGNLSEVGFFDKQTGGTLFCRQRIRDANKQPTTLTKTNEFTLRVTYEFRLYPPLGPDVPGSLTVTIAGSPTTVATTTRAYRINDNYVWNAGKTGYNPTASSGPDTYVVDQHAHVTHTSAVSLPGTSRNDGGSVSPYVGGSHKRECISTWSPSQGNITGGIGSIVAGLDYWASTERSWGRFHTVLGTRVTKTNTQRLTLVHDFSWARHTIPTT